MMTFRHPGLTKRLHPHISACFPSTQKWEKLVFCTFKSHYLTAKCKISSWPNKFQWDSNKKSSMSAKNRTWCWIPDCRKKCKYFWKLFHLRSEQVLSASRIESWLDDYSKAYFVALNLPWFTLLYFIFESDNAKIFLI